MENKNGGVTTIKFFKNWGHITLEVVFCLYIRKLNVWRFQGFKDSKKWKTNIVESPPKGFSNFESHITVERVLYLYYPASCVTFSKGLRFKVIEKQTWWSHHQLENRRHHFRKGGAFFNVLKTKKTRKIKILPAVITC